MNRLLALATVLVVALPGAARAQVDLLSRDAFSGLIDFRVAAAATEDSWIDGGFGKTRYSDGAAVEPAEAHLIWKPRLNWSLGATIDLQAQAGPHPRVDIGEAFVTYRPLPTSPTRVSARLGLMYPPISMEHHGGAWTVTDMITPSAINSWVGEEVKVVALEGTVSREVAGHRLSATAAAFGYNDTSGTLLSFRGWALHDLKAGAETDFPLPALSAFMTPRQAPITTPAYELDNRIGYYGRIDWAPPGSVSFNAFYYDNRGDRVAVEAVQWSWETRFLNVGVRADLDENTWLIGQALSGETFMGYPYAGETWVDAGFASAFLRLSHRFRSATVTARVDWFEVTDRSLQVLDDNEEDGWAATAAVSIPLSDHVELLAEALHVSSDRPSRAYAGRPATADEDLLQSSLRLMF